MRVATGGDSQRRLSRSHLGGRTAEAATTMDASPSGGEGERGLASPRARGGGDYLGMPRELPSIFIISPVRAKAGPRIPTIRASSRRPIR